MSHAETAANNAMKICFPTGLSFSKKVRHGRFASRFAAEKYFLRRTLALCVFYVVAMIFVDKNPLRF